MEHRCGERVGCCVQVRIKVRHAMIGRGTLREVSVSGGFVETVLHPAEASMVRMACPPGCSAAAGATLHGWVVRNNEGGFAVEWDLRSVPAARGLLSTAIEQIRRADPGKATRERATNSQSTSSETSMLPKVPPVNFDIGEEA